MTTPAKPIEKKQKKLIFYWNTVYTNMSVANAEGFVWTFNGHCDHNHQSKASRGEEGATAVTAVVCNGNERELLEFNVQSKSY